MPVRSILDIDVSDDKFKAFLDSFQKYQDALSKMPGAWRQVTVATAAPSAAIADMTAAILAQNEQLALALKHESAFGREVERTSRTMTGLERATRGVALHITEATRSLLTWGTVLTATSGLLGLGGLWGIEKLAGTATGGYRSSLGLGLSYGEQRAFGTTFGRYVDPRAFLGNVNVGLTDATSPQYRAMLALGFTPEQIAQMDTGQAATALLPRLQQFAKGTRRELLGPTAEAMGITSLAGVEDLQRLRSLPGSTLQQSIQDYAKRADEQNRVAGQVLEAWTKLDIALSGAEKAVTDALITGLAPLAPELEAISKAFADAVQAFLKSPEVKHWMEAVTGGLEEFAGYIGSDQFKQDMHNFVTGVGDMAKAIGDFLAWFTKTQPGEMFSGKEKTGIVGGAFIGGALGGAIGGPLGMVIGGTIGALAGYGETSPRKKMIDPRTGAEVFIDPMTGAYPPGAVEAPPPPADVYHREEAEWKKAQAAGTDTRSMAEFQRDWLTAHDTAFKSALESWQAAKSGGKDDRSLEEFERDWSKTHAAPRAALATNYEAISRAEGTYGATGINYNAVYGGERAGLTQMTLDEVQALQAQLAQSGSTAVGGFEVLRGTLQDAIKGLQLDPATTKFTPEVQRRIADWVHARQGYGAWAGFRAHPEELQRTLGSEGAQSAEVWWGADATNPRLRAFLRGTSGLDPKEEAWCAAFANASLAVQGISGTGSNLATSFERWGKAIDPNQVQAGDVVVLPRGHGPGETGGHVGRATGREWGDLIEMISGNARGHKVDYSWERKQDVIVRRPLPPTTHVTVDNRTGGSAIVSASQLGPP